MQTHARFRWLVAVCIALASGLNTFAHTLPISSMLIVPDKDYVHVELSLNPFELNFLPTTSWEQTGRLDDKTLQKQNQLIADKIKAALKLRGGGESLHAETSGVWSDTESHHLTFLAHYRADVLHRSLTVESDLGDLTSSSHVTEVTYQFGERQQLARFDAQAHHVIFDPFERTETSASTTAVLPTVPQIRASFWTFHHMFLLVAVSSVILLGGFVWKLREHFHPQT